MRNDTYTGTRAQTQIDEGLRDHMSGVYRKMATGMGITTLSAWAVSAAAFVDTGGVRGLTPFGALLFDSPLKWLIMFAPLVMVLFAGFRFEKLSWGVLNAIFYGMAALIGVSFSTLLITFTGASIAGVFLATTVAFAGLSLAGYVTKRDLSPMGAFLFMGVIGLIVVMIANIFIQSEAVVMATSVLGVLIFAGLTAYDTQKAKTDYLSLSGYGADAETLGKHQTISALSLYLDFVNMFSFLMNLLGVRRD